MQLARRQIKVIESNLLHAFEERTLAHLRRYYPRHCKLLGDEQMLRVIRYGLAKASHYQLTPECCVRSYIDLMCLLGGGFDDDVLLPWAAELLAERRIGDPIARGDALHDRAWEYIRHVVPDFRKPDGTPTTARFVYELRALREESDAPVHAASAAGFAQALEARIARNFPAKCRYVGARAVRQVIVDAMTTAPRYGLRGARGTTLYATLLFLLGAGMASDPLLPWVHATLHDPTLIDETQKVDKLFTSAVHVLRQWWDPETMNNGA